MTTTCQICGREIKANKGMIAHHGYQRPGHGWQTASCFGARWRPYEVACDALPPAIDSLTRYLDTQEAALIALLADPPAVFECERVDAYGRVRDKWTAARPDGFTPDTRPDYMPKSYVTEFNRRRHGFEDRIKHGKYDLDALSARLVGWAPQNVEPVVTTETVERCDRWLRDLED